MNNYIFLIITVVSTFSGAYAQIDTLSIHHQIQSLKSNHDHQQFWTKIYKQDQGLRGSDTVDSIDLLNIVKASMYFNEYGYPSPAKAGKQSTIISTVWIHNSIPEIDRICFSLIMHGYLSKNISESSLRTYFLRSTYHKNFEDDGNRTKPIKQILQELDLTFSKRIKIQAILDAYLKGKAFLEKNHKEIGYWEPQNHSDTLHLNNGEPYVIETGFDPIRIFQDEKGTYYFQYLYNDGSYYPRPILRDSERTFRFSKEFKSHFKVLENGDLEVVFGKGTNRIYRRIQKSKL